MLLIAYGCIQQRGCLLANHTAATQCIKACDHSQEYLLKVKLSIRMDKKGV